jgi:hypothetical protein
MTRDVTGAEILGRYGSYARAQKTVDLLSDAGFPMQHLSIVGDDLKGVEQVTGRLTAGRAALLGAAEGAWMGGILAVLLAVITPLVLLSILLAVPLAAAGGVAGMHFANRGARDCASTGQIVAGSYAVLVAKLYAADARALLGHE